MHLPPFVVRIAVVSLLAPLLLVVGCRPATTAPTAPSSARADSVATPSTVAAAYRLLARTDTFADRSVGYAGALSDQVAAFRVVLASPSARASFVRLLREGRTAGKLYALAGLWHLDRAAFRTGAARLATSRDVVKVQFGCLMLSRPVAALVDGGGSAIRLASGETLGEAIDARGPGELDLIGGGFPVAFASDGGVAP